MLSWHWDDPDFEIISKRLNHSYNNNAPWDKDKSYWNKWKRIGFFGR